MRLGFWVNSFPCDTNRLNDHFQRCWGCCYNPLLGFLLQPTLYIKLHSCCSQFLPIHPTTPDPVRPLPNLRLVGERSTQGSLILNIRPTVSYCPKFYLRQYFVHTCAILCAPPEYHHWEGCGSLLSRYSLLSLKSRGRGRGPFFYILYAILTFFFAE